MKIVRDAMAVGELKAMVEGVFGNLVKAVVDVERGIMALDGKLHSDEEALLLEDGSVQRDLWESTSTRMFPGMVGLSTIPSSTSGRRMAIADAEWKTPHFGRR